MKRNFVRVLPLVIIAAATWVALTQTQNIKDWFAVRSFEPSAAIEALARDTGMSDEGRRLFYASQPALNDRQQFNDNCEFPDRSLVLGCYSAQRIYIFSVDDERLEGVEEVTAAHEMLHAVYDRMSAGERERIDDLVTRAYAGINNERLRETIEGYEESDPSVVENELHSILGTEHRNLSLELEEHYAQYFTDRDAVLDISEAYEKVFESLQDDIARLDNQIASLKSQISSLESKLESMSEFLNSEAERLESLLNANNISGYNAAVPGYNSTVNEFNATIDQYESRVNRHNTLVEERNSIAVEQNDLVQSLDSKFQPIVN